MNIQQKRDHLSINLEGKYLDFTRKLSCVLRSHFKQGTVVLQDLAHDVSQAIILSAWYAGWRVAILPPHLSLEVKHLLLIQLQANLIISTNNNEVIQIKGDHRCQSITIDAHHQISSITSWIDSQYQAEKLDYPSYLWSKNHTALVLFTSGSTGIPKGVCHSLFGILASAERFIQHFKISATDRLLNTALIHTMSGFRCSVMLPIICGCQVNKSSINGGVFQILELLEKERPTVIITGPNIIRQLSMLRDKIGNLTTSIRFVLCTGAKLNLDDRLSLFEKLNLKVINYYGLTETGGLAIAESDQTYNAANKSIGKACNDVEIKVIDRDGQEIDRGYGELRVYCSSIFLGYLGQDLSLNRSFDTGDLVEIDSVGDVTLLHRLKSGVKATNTEWIYPETVALWLRTNTLIIDVHISVYYDTYERANFQAEVAGINPANWEEWSAATYQRLLIDLGQHYQVIKWVMVCSIVRSNLGKYQRTIY